MKSRSSSTGGIGENHLFHPLTIMLMLSGCLFCRKIFPHADAEVKMPVEGSALAQIKQKRSALQPVTLNFENN
jgi:hypothetical protein